MERVANKTIRLAVGAVDARFGAVAEVHISASISEGDAAARGVMQAGLIGASAAIAFSCGLPAMAGVAIGAMIFAPKHAADLIKAAREALPALAKG